DRARDRAQRDRERLALGSLQPEEELDLARSSPEIFDRGRLSEIRRRPRLGEGIAGGNDRRRDVVAQLRVDVRYPLRVPVVGARQEARHELEGSGEALGESLQPEDEEGARLGPPGGIDARGGTGEDRSTGIEKGAEAS